MNGNKSTLFRYLFHDRKAYKKFKKAYTSAPIDKKIATILMAEKIKATGPVKNVEMP